MQNAGVNILFGPERMAFMGFSEVLKHLRTIRKNFKEVKADILAFNPDVVILVDYPGFNLRMARWCKEKGYKVVYFISPQLWAWKEGRVETVKKYVDMVLCVLPFERDFYLKHGYENAYYIGHPLLDSIGPGTVETTRKEGIALLPGSRQQEISKLLPLMLELAARMPQYTFRVAAMAARKESYPQQLPQNAELIFDAMDDVLRHSLAAVVCSGTATLETALYSVPQVVVYKTSWLNYQLAKRLAKVDFIALPNLIAGKQIVPELIQQDCQLDKLIHELEKVLQTNAEDVYAPMQEAIGNPGAAKKAANLIFKLSA